MHFIVYFCIFGILWTVINAQCDTDCGLLGFVPKVSMQSVIYPGRFWRHCSGLGFLDNNHQDNNFCNPNVFHGDVTFIMLQPGLAGGDKTVSFQSANYPTTFLRQKDKRLRIDSTDGCDNFNKDATFTMMDGKATNYNGNSFMSVSHPDYFVRDCSNKLYIDNNDGSNADCSPDLKIFLKEITFLVTTGLDALK